MRFLPGTPMRKWISLALAASAAWLVLDSLQPSSFGDIQDPPYNVHGPIRKLGRGLANIAFAGSELYVWADIENESMGNSASNSSLNGLWRCLTRIGVGIYDVLTFPAPTWKGSYAPVDGALHRSCIPWVNGGFEEFPPELGFETRLPYARVYSGTTRLP
jgi:putative exosortase-associated protein (TIGR04073 family)